MTGSEVSKRAPRIASSTTLSSDARLARRAAKRDERAFATIFRRYHQEIYRFCLTILGNAEDARDALQNTMVKALQALPGEERQIELKPWLYRVAHNESIDLVRKRRETTAIDPELTAAADSLAETAAQRERLRQLLLDLGDLPDRQRTALVMRELGGLGFEQIGEAFDTSPAVARQTVYEARLSLRSLEEGREMSCEEVMHRLSNADGRVARRRDLQAHLRACSDCRAFRDAIDTRRRDFAAMAPLPAIASVGVLHAILGGAQGAGGVAGASGATVAAGAGKAVTAGVVGKSIATVAIVAAVGASAADRGGLIHTGLPGGSSGTTSTKQVEDESTSNAAAAATSAAHSQSGASTTPATGKAPNDQADGKGTTAKSSHHGQTTGHGEGTAGSLPAASQHGQETAAAHRSGAAASHGQAHDRSTHPSHHQSHHGHRSGHVKSKARAHPNPKPVPPSKPSHEEGQAQPSAETTPKAEQSSGSGSGGAESSVSAEGMP